MTLNKEQAAIFFQEKMIPYYEEALKTVKEFKKVTDHKSVLKFLATKNLHLGICHCALRLFNKQLGLKIFYEYLDWSRVYITQVPEHLDRIEDIIESMQQRISVMKKIVSRYN